MKRGLTVIVALMTFLNVYLYLQYPEDFRQTKTTSIFRLAQTYKEKPILQKIMELPEDPIKAGTDVPVVGAVIKVLNNFLNFLMTLVKAVAIYVNIIIEVLKIVKKIIIPATS